MHLMRPSILALASCLVLVAGCIRGSRVAPIAEFRGHYTPGFEVSRFVACGAPPDDQPWWVVLSPRAFEQRDSAMRALPPVPGSRVFVRWRGALGAQAATGHLGKSARHLHVMELAELRAPREDDCE